MCCPMLPTFDCCLKGIKPRSGRAFGELLQRRPAPFRSSRIQDRRREPVLVEFQRVAEWILDETRVKCRSVHIEQGRGHMRAGTSDPIVRIPHDRQVSEFVRYELELALKIATFSVSRFARQRARPALFTQN